jgi:hypothetical protein
MNRYLKSRALIAVILTVNLLGIIACSSTQKATYVTLATTANVVEAARKGYDDLYQAGKISEATDAKVLVAYTKYQGAMNAALGAFKAYKRIADAGGVPDPAVTNKLIDDLQPVITELFALFTQSGVTTAQSIVIEKVK